MYSNIQNNDIHEYDMIIYSKIPEINSNFTGICSNIQHHDVEESNIRIDRNLLTCSECRELIKYSR